MTEEQAREAALEQAMQRAFISDAESRTNREYITEIFDAGVEYANRWTYLPELPKEYTAVLVTITNGTVTLAVVTKDQKFLNVDGDPFTKYPVIAWRELPEPAKR